jgi:hypothetical protein
MTGVLFKLNNIARLVKSALINEQLNVVIAPTEQLYVNLPVTEQLDVTI